MNEQIVYGSHNTMTYLPIKNWWMFPGLLIARCQNHSIEEQFNRGARVFDLRVYLNKKSKQWEFAHGLINFKSYYDICKVIRNINKFTGLNSLSQENGHWFYNEQIRDIYVRIILEKWSSESECRQFSKMCKTFEICYPELKFIGGNRKGDWKKLYTFKNDVPDSLNNQWVSSMAEDARWYEKVFPFLYALRMNKKNRLRMKEKLNLFDFV